MSVIPPTKGLISVLHLGWTRQAIAAFRAAIEAEVRSIKSFSSEAVPLPTPVLAIAASILVANIVMIFIGGWVTGVSTDEPTHLMRLQSYFDTGWYLAGWQLNGKDPAGMLQDTYSYGPVASLVAHWLAVLLGIENPSQIIPRVFSYEAITATGQIYATHHIAVAFFGALGIAAVAGIARHLFQSWRWAVLSAAVLSAIPLWTGFAMFNIKDTPVATGYTLATLGIIGLSRPDIFASCLHLFRGITAFALGIIIAVGTRPGIWPAFAVAVLIMLIVTMWISTRIIGFKNSFLASLMRAGMAFTSILTAYLVLLAIYPKLFSNPIKWLLLSVKTSSHYNWKLLTISAGVVHGQPPPWWYLPVWACNQIPLLILILVIIGLGFTIVLSTRILLRRATNDGGYQLSVGLLLVSAQALLLPLAAIAGRSVMYTGFRQLLFIAPAVSVQAVAGAWLLIKFAKRISRLTPMLLVATSTLVSVAIVLPTYDQTQLFPYNYVYFNEIATLQPINGRWATDYWQTSLRELVPKISAEGNVYCQSGFSKNPQQLAEPYLPYHCTTKNCGTPVLLPFWSSRGQHKTIGFDPNYQFWYVSENYFGSTIPNNCTLAEEVTRPLRGQKLMMSFVARCDMPIPEYPEKGISFLGKASTEYLLFGWSHPEDYGSWSTGTQSTIGMKLPDVPHEQPLKLTLEGFRLVPKGEKRTMHVFVNDIPIGEYEFDDSHKPIPVTLSVPAVALLSRDGGRVIIKLETPNTVTPQSIGIGSHDTRPLGFFLKSLRIDRDSGAIN